MKFYFSTRARFAKSSLTALVLTAGLVGFQGCSRSSAPDLSDSQTSAEVPAAEPKRAAEPELRYPIPDGSPAELASFLTEMAVRDPVGDTPDETTTDLAEIMNTRRYAADRIFQMPDVDPVFQLMASEAKLESLRTLSLIGRGTEGDFEKFADQLIESDDVAIAQVGRIGKLQRTLDEVHALGAVDTEQLLSSVREIASYVDRDDHPDLRALYALSEASNLLRQIDEAETAITVINLGADLLADTTGDTESALDILTRYAGELELVGQIDKAETLLEVVEKNFGSHADEALQATATAVVDQARRRLAMTGQPLEILAGEESDFENESIDRKIVLMQFWSASNSLTDARFKELKKLYRRYHENGLAVVGVCLDDASTMNAYLDDKDIPWPNICDGGAEEGNAGKFGIDASLTPYAVLADATGRIVLLNPPTDLLRKSVTEWVAQIEKDQDEDREEAVETTVTEDDKKTASSTPPLAPSSADSEETLAEDDKASKEPTDGQSREGQQEQTDGPTVAADGPDATTEGTNRNPYLAATDLTTSELVEFILDMQDKTRSIQLRDGFAAAVIDASDRLLKADAKDRFQVIALLAKLNYLHRDASAGDDAATEALYKTVEEFRDDPRPAIADEITFLTAERDVLDGTDDDRDLGPVIESALQYFSTAEDLGEKHLPMASATVGLINRLEERSERERYFDTLGTCLVKSENKTVSRYGQRLAKGDSESSDPTVLIGQTIDLLGETVDGHPFDLQQYRGEVVLLDFWATWCGPCRELRPQIRALYEKENERGFDVIGISLDQDLDQLDHYLKAHTIPWTVLAGESTMDLADKCHVRAIPLLMMVDTDGKVVATGQTLTDVTKELDALLAARPKD